MGAFGTIIFAPVVETLLLIFLLRFLQSLRLSDLQACVVSAIIWGIGHAWVHPLAFFGTIWSFFVFNWSFLLWRQRSRAHGYWAAALPHVFVNTVAVALTLA